MHTITLILLRRSLEGTTTIVQSTQQPANGAHSTRRSIETLVVILAAITIMVVVAGICARVCGRRHLAGGSDHDIEGWIERNCRSCLDGGVPPPRPTAAEVPKSNEARK
ncbi:fission regulator-like protein [Rhynchospora pubera]|uniref:Fission regulator-like protein n=1 Tax=Rhynchospora pubera TaxID=906938 RepID=A0AAV8CIG3_9POAL|nr:fission regulator-like protein [Rhynchospora pubera]